MVSKLNRHVFVEGIVGSQFDGDLRHVLSEQRHPRRAVGLLQISTRGQRRAAIEDADIVQAQKSALKEVLAEAVLAVHPPAEVQHQLGKRALQEFHIAGAPERLLGAIQEDRCPGVNRRIHIAEVPFVGRNLTGGVQEKFLQHQVKLLLGEVEIDDAQCHGVKRQVPRRVPRILPFVGHGNYVLVDHVEPFDIAKLLAVGIQRIDAVLLQPLVDLEAEVLLGPQHSGQRLAHDVCLVLVEARRRDGAIELVGFGRSRREQFGEILERITHVSRSDIAQPQLDGLLLTGFNRQLIMGGSILYRCFPD